MPMLKRPDAEIYYEVHGAGFPLLLYAPGGQRSQTAEFLQDSIARVRAFLERNTPR